VQSIRFAVELKYTGVKKKIVKTKRLTIMSNASSRITNRNSSFVAQEAPTFAIIKICLLAPLGETYHELKVFRESFISQNRLLHCNRRTVEPPKVPLSELQREHYTRFDAFIRETIRYIIEKNIHSVEEKRGYFCCVLQNLTNILMKVIGCDFNQRTHTTTNVEFAVNITLIKYVYIYFYKFLSSLESLCFCL